MANTSKTRYWEFIKRSNIFFTKGRIYTLNHGKKISDEGAFIDNQRKPNGCHPLNTSYFKPSTKEAYDLQEDVKNKSIKTPKQTEKEEFKAGDWVVFEPTKSNTTPGHWDRKMVLPVSEVIIAGEGSFPHSKGVVLKFTESDMNRFAPHVHWGMNASHNIKHFRKAKNSEIPKLVNGEYYKHKNGSILRYFDSVESMYYVGKRFKLTDPSKRLIDTFMRGDGNFTPDIREYTTPTQEEINWLEYCNTADDYIPKEEYLKTLRPSKTEDMFKKFDEICSEESKCFKVLENDISTTTYKMSFPSLSEEEVEHLNNWIEQGSIKMPKGIAQDPKEKLLTISLTADEAYEIKRILKTRLDNKSSELITAEELVSRLKEEKSFYENLLDKIDLNKVL